MSYLMTTALIEEIEEQLPQDPSAVRARLYMQDYRSGLSDATTLFNQLVGLREQDKEFFRRMDRLTNGQWSVYVIYLVK